MDLIDYDLVTIETEDYRVTVYMIWYNYTTGKIEISNGLSLSRETIQELAFVGSDAESTVESILYKQMKDGNFNKNNIDSILNKTNPINLPKYIDFKINQLLS